MIPQGFISMDKISLAATNLPSGQKSTAGSKDLFSAILASISNRTGMNKLPDFSILSSADVSTEKSKAGLLELVKKYALTKSGNLDNLTFDEKGLKDFEKFLLGAGFDPESVSALMEKLKAKMGGRELKLSDLFQELKDLKNPSEETEEEEKGDMLELSALPYIEAALSSLGVRQSEITVMINQATIEGDGINLDRLIKALKGLKNSAIEGNSLKGANDHPITAGNATDGKNGNGYVADMMTRLGVKSAFGKEKAVTLDDFISGLESLTAKKENANEVASLLNADLRRFFEKVTVQTEATAQAKSIGLKEKYLTQEADKKSALSDKYSFLNRKNPQTAPTETQPDTNASFEKSGLEKNVIEGRFSGKSSEGATTASLTLKTSGKTSGTISQMTKTESTTSYEGLIRDINNPDPSTTGASEAKPGGRTLPMYVVDQVGRQIVRSVNNGESEIRLQIKPPSLGRLHMTIDNTSDGVRISILAENRTAKDLILANASELKIAIQSQGIQINEIDVQVSPDFQQAMQDMRQKESHGKGHGREKGEEKNNSGSSEITGTIASSGIMGPGSGRLDLVA